MTAPMYALWLPWPPSVNSYYVRAARKITRGNRAGRSYVGERISNEGLVFRSDVARIVRSGHCAPPRFSGRLVIRAVALPPVLNRTRDLDNLWKSLLDALTAAGVILDDALFDEVTMHRGPKTEKGALRFGLWRPDDGVRGALFDSLGIAVEKDMLVL